MIQFNQIPSRWLLTGYPSEEKLAALSSSHLIASPVSSGPLTPLLSGLLPDHDHNGGLIQWLQSLPRGRSAPRPVFSVFAADPFLEGKRLAQRLQEKGYQRVVNWPTTAQYGLEFSAQLDSVNLGPKKEYENLLRLAERGLSISFAVCTADAAIDFARLKPELLFLTPSFDLWTNRKMRSRELLRRCAALADAVHGSVPIVLMAARGAVSLAEARKAGASALLSA